MKLIGETDCPHCKKTHDAEFNLENLEQVPKTISKATIKEITNGNQTQTLEEPKVIEKIKEVLPSNIPAFKCKDGNCGRVHKNPNYKRAPTGKCTNCGQFTSDLDTECPWCNKKEFEEIEDSDLEDLGIPIPEHSHSHED